jgi:hypothetical protein
MTQIPSFSSFKNLFILAISLLIFWNCKKDNPVEPPLVDSKLVGVWYNRVDTVGFEILGDGTMRNLQVDAGGKLEYAPAQDTVTGALTFKIESARGSAISIRGSYKSHTIDSTYVTTGTYNFSNNDNTLTLTLFVPLNGSSQATFVYLRSSVGAVVVLRKGWS